MELYCIHCGSTLKYNGRWPLRNFKTKCPTPDKMVERYYCMQCTVEDPKFKGLPAMGVSIVVN